MRLDRPLQYRLARAGQEPADALTTHDRDILFHNLMRMSLSVQEMSRLTRCTDYTVNRICDRLRASRGAITPTAQAA